MRRALWKRPPFVLPSLAPTVALWRLERSGDVNLMPSAGTCLFFPKEKRRTGQSGVAVRKGKEEPGAQRRSGSRAPKRYQTWWRVSPFWFIIFMLLSFLR